MGYKSLAQMPTRRNGPVSSNVRPHNRMSDTPTCDEFVKMMADFSSAYLDPAFKNMKAGKPHTQPTDEVFATLFYGYAEITDAIDSLTLCETLIGVAPPRSKAIEKDRYLKFIVGTYLQEVYILEQRLTAYAKKISRLYGIPGIPKAVQQVVYEPLEGIINTRGAHVHAQRFSDKHLSSVSQFALLRRLRHPLGEDFDFEYKLAQMEWKSQAQKNNKAILKIVEQYFRILRIVLAPKGKIDFPRARSK